MCGIVGAIADRDVVPVLIEGLKRLEYRGYDSAGIAVFDGQDMRRVRRTGRVSEMEAAAQAEDFHAGLGIGHTRWATHGGVTEANAHPHISFGELAVVHNGIIENHEEQRERLRGLGYTFESQTDTEVIAHLIHYYQSQGRDLLEAVRFAVRELTGAYAIAVVSKHEPGRMIAARMGCPLLVGLGDGENFIASDVSAILQSTRRVIFLEEGDTAEVRREGVQRVRHPRRAGRARSARLRRVAGLAGAGPVPPLHAEGDPRAAACDRRHDRSGDGRQWLHAGAVRCQCRRRARRESKACRSSPAAPATTPA